MSLALAAVAAVCFGTAMAVQKYALGRLPRFSISGMVRNRAWLASLAVSAAGLLAYAAALRSLPLSTVQPLISGYIVIPVLAGAALFHEKLGGRQWLAVALLLGGVLVLSFSA